MYQRALQGYEKALGMDNIETYIPALRTLWCRGSLSESQARLVEARIMYSKALVGYEKVVGPDHPWTRYVRDKLCALDTLMENNSSGMAEPVNRFQGEMAHPGTEGTP